MSEGRAETPSTGYHSARSRTASMESTAATSSRRVSRVDLEPLVAANGRRQAIGVSCTAKRQFKDRRIYVNPKTGLPVRPPTSFGLFKHALRRKMGDKVDFAEFNRKATEQWTKLEEGEKEPYARRARELSEQFKKIEVGLLRKKVRQLQRQVRNYRREYSASRRRSIEGL